jgi:hypothetical protein
MTDPGLPRPAITCQGRDDSVWRYFALHGPQLSPQETGWVLVVTGVPGLEDPQVLSAAEVVRDVASMTDGDPVSIEIVRDRTQAMLAVLEERRADQREEPELDRRIAELRAELEEVR